MYQLRKTTVLIHGTTHRVAFFCEKLNSFVSQAPYFYVFIISGMELNLCPIYKILFMKKLLLSALASLMMMATGMDAQAQNCTFGELFNTTDYGSDYDVWFNGHKITLTETTVINTLSTEIRNYEVLYGTGQGRFILMKLTANNQMESIIASPRFSYSTQGYIDVMMDDVTLAPGVYAIFNYLPASFGNYTMYSYSYHPAGEGYLYTNSFNSLLANNIDVDLSSVSNITLYNDNSRLVFNHMYMSYTAKEEITNLICGSSYTINGVEYTENTTVYHDRRAGVSATCDSITVTHLQFNSLTNYDQFITQCETYTWPINGETYAESAVVTFDAGQTVFGCDSTVTLHLTINARPSAAITLEEQTLTVTTPADSYIWLDCNEDLLPILNANAQAFTPVRTGNYRAIVTTNGCSATTECVQVDYLGLDNPLDNLLSVYPNPTSGVVNLDFGTELSLTSVELYNVNGQLIETISGAATVSSMTFNVSQEAGVYLLKLTANEQTKTVRLIKQ